MAGHNTTRNPELSDQFWANPPAMYFGHIGVSDLLLVKHDCEVLQGNRPANRAAFPIHAALDKARLDAVAAAGAHWLYGKVWSTFDRKLDPLTQNSLFFNDDHAVFDDYAGVVVTNGEDDSITAALGDKRTVILQNHGHVTVGGSVEAAVWHYIAFEDAARVQLLVAANASRETYILGGQPGHRGTR